MKRRTLLSSLIAAGSYSLLGELSGAEPRAPTLLTANGKRAMLGVYLGAGCAGTERLKAYESWLGRSIDQTLEFISWEVLAAGSTWAVNCWRKSGQQAVTYSLPMLPPDRSATLAQGAEGRFDDLFSRYGVALVKQGYGDSIIRIGWEFNAGWYAWDASKDPESWIVYWRRIVAALRKVPGASFKYDWCPAAAARGFSADLAYPGDDFVDIIGMDFYNMPIDREADTPERRWDTRMGMQHGLKWHRDFAHSHGKPMSFPEWGTGVHVKWGGPADDPVFIDHMASWIKGSPVVYHNYWEHWSKEYSARLSGGGQPEGAAMYLRRFGKGKSAALAPRYPAAAPA